MSQGNPSRDYLGPCSEHLLTSVKETLACKAGLSQTPAPAIHLYPRVFCVVVLEIYVKRWYKGEALYISGSFRPLMMLIARHVDSCTFNLSPIGGHWVISSLVTISKLVKWTCCTNMVLCSVGKWCLFFLSFLKKFYYSIVDLQCVNFRCTTKWISYTYTYISYTYF